MLVSNPLKRSKKHHTKENVSNQDQKETNGEPVEVENEDSESKVDHDETENETDNQTENKKSDSHYTLEKAEKELESIETLKDNYHNILVFLWSVSQGLRSNPGLPLPFCFKKHTTRWVQSMHSQHITNPMNNLPPLPPGAPFQAIPTNLNLPNVTTIQPSSDMKDLTSEFKSLARAINNNALSTLTEKQEKKSEKSKTKFNKMSTIKKNIVVML